jgi:hypothetical protein
MNQSSVNVQVKSVKVDGVTIYPVYNNLVDVFWGDGWDNQARYKFNGRSWDLWNSTKKVPRNIDEVLSKFKGVK